MYWSAFLIGILGNFHCIGMCGPIALSLPIGRLSAPEKVTQVLLYNLGRVIAYGFLGGLIGVFGLGLRYVGVVQTLSIISGGFLIMFGFFTLPFVSIRFKGRSLAIGKWIKKQLGYYMQQRKVSTLFFVGFFNGLLPCGLVYAGLIGSLTAESWTGGVVYMMLFGLGTLPFMLVLPFAGSLISIRVRNIMRKSVPFALILFGLLFVVRGANLGIPYLSPKIEMADEASPSNSSDKAQQPVMYCH